MTYVVMNVYKRKKFVNEFGLFFQGNFYFIY